MEHTSPNHELALVSFILPVRQERYLELLAKPKTRDNIGKELSHFRLLDPRCVVPIVPRFQHVKDILTILKEKGAPESCSVFFEADELNGKTLPLTEALREIVGRQIGTFLSCVPGQLAYFEDEDMRCILERPISSRK